VAAERAVCTVGSKAGIGFVALGHGSTDDQRAS
jgi:hypothetical protein